MNKAGMAGVLLAMLAGTAMAQGPAIDYGVAAEVVRGMMSEQVGRSIVSSTNLMANYRNSALEQALAQEAARRGLTERIDVQRTIEDLRRETLILALRTDVMRAVETPTDDAVKKEYQKQKANLVLPAAQKLDVYTVSAVQTQLIEKALALATSGAEIAGPLTKRGFVHVSAQLAEPWFTSNQVAAAIWDRVTAMKNGESEVFPDGANVLLIRKLDARDARPMTLEEATPLVRDFLVRDRRNEAWNAFVAEMSRGLGF
jgi:hypothetical protein